MHNVIISSQGAQYSELRRLTGPDLTYIDNIIMAKQPVQTLHDVV